MLRTEKDPSLRFHARERTLLGAPGQVCMSERVLIEFQHSLKTYKIKIAPDT